MDAWVWMDHGHVFANAQTANVVLFGIHVAAGDFTTAARHVPPVMAFILGLVASRLSGAWLKKAGLNSRNVRLTVECVLLVALALIASRLPNGVVTAGVGFIAAVQITSLSHIGDMTFNTGMTTGNLSAPCRRRPRSCLTQPQRRIVLVRSHLVLCASPSRSERF